MSGRSGLSGLSGLSGQGGQGGGGQGGQGGQSCLTANEWICGEYLRSRSQELLDATAQHVLIAASSVVIGLLAALPLALLARRWRGLAGPVLGLTTVLYTVPSLAMFALLMPVFGLSASVVVTGLALYSLTVLVRNILAGLDAVPAGTREAARGMGYGPARLLLEVELPLALPALMAGLRIAAVSAVSLTTVGAIVGHGGLGNLLYAGLDSFFKAQVLTASVICVVLAVLADVLLLGAQRLLTPWTRHIRSPGASARRRGAVSSSFAPVPASASPPAPAPDHPASSAASAAPASSADGKAG